MFERSWSTRELPEDWRKTNVASDFKKGKKEELRKLQVSQPHLYPREYDGTTSKQKKRRLSGADNMDSPRKSCVWPSWLPSMMSQLPG